MCRAQPETVILHIDRLQMRPLALAPDDKNRSGLGVCHQTGFLQDPRQQLLQRLSRLRLHKFKKFLGQILLIVHFTKPLKKYSYYLHQASFTIGK